MEQQYGDDFISITDEDGKEYELEVLAELEHNGSRYLALVPAGSGISPLGGTGLLLGTFAGAAVWQTLENGLNMIGAQVGIQRVVIGVIVVAAVLLDVVVRNGQFGKHRKK